MHVVFYYAIIFNLLEKQKEDLYLILIEYNIKYH